MAKESINHLRKSINSKFSKLHEVTEKEDSFNDNLENITDDVNLDYDFNEDIIRREFSYITNTKDISILYVDDESHNLNSFYACLRHDFNIFLAHNTDIALDILNKEKIDIVITDQKMPKITGLEFLTNIKNKFKKSPIFMILSAYVDAEVLMNAINDVHIFKFLHKPFNVEEIKNSITEAYSYHLNK